MAAQERFRDRDEAGRLLAAAMERWREPGLLVLGIPRGGVPVAAHVARALGATLDIVVARKVGAPGQPELAIGAVTANGGRYLNDEYIRDLAVSREYLEVASERAMQEARDREVRLRAGRAVAPIAGRTVIVVDDGLATGATMRAALRSVRQARPGRLVMAVPVGAPDSCDAMRSEADEVVCLVRPPLFYAVGAHYDEFDPVEDEEVVRILHAFDAQSDDDEPAPERSLEIVFRNNVGRRLAGTLLLPAANAPVPAVVFSHGMGSGRTSSRNRAIADRLVKAGVAAFLIDFTGHGSSEGSMEDATLERMSQDLASAIDALEQRPEVDRGRIGVSGSSSGAVVTLVLAAGDQRIRALVLRAVPASGMLDVARNVRVPTLVIAGEDDWPIVRDDEELAGQIAGEHSFVVIPAAGHLFEGPGQAERVAELSAAWFGEKLLAKTPASPRGTSSSRGVEP